MPFPNGQSSHPLQKNTTNCPHVRILVGRDGYETGLRKHLRVMRRQYRQTRGGELHDVNSRLVLLHRGQVNLQQITCLMKKIPDSHLFGIEKKSAYVLSVLVVGQLQVIELHPGRHPIMAATRRIGMNVYRRRCNETRRL